MSCDRNKLPEIHFHFHGLPGVGVVAPCSVSHVESGERAATLGNMTISEVLGTPEEKLSARCTQLSDACSNVKAAMVGYLRERYPDSSPTHEVDRNAATMRLERVIAALFDELEQATT
jgi:hypothetical protein